MKKSKKCPKCQSRKIAGPIRDEGRLHVSHFSGPLATVTYACVECGYVERFLKSSGKEELKKKGVFTLNPTNWEITHCPECDTKFKQFALQCKKCGFERDFAILDEREEF